MFRCNATATITHPWHYRQPWIVNGFHVLFAWVNQAQTSKCFLSKENEGPRVLTLSAVVSTPSYGAPSGLPGRQTSSSATQPVPLGPAEVWGNFRETGLHLPDKCLFKLAFLTQQAVAHSLVDSNQLFLVFSIIGSEASSVQSWFSPSTFMCVLRVVPRSPGSVPTTFIWKSSCWPQLFSFLRTG